MKKTAFTLAEVMIVLAIIGVVAIFTMPVLLSEVTERVNSNRQANIAQKVTKAVELMIVNGDYEQFETTEEFADKLQKYLKILKRCNNSNLTQCWPTNKITTSDGNKYNVADATTGRQLHTNNDTNTVGLILADGGNILLTYNPNATIPNADTGFKPTKKELPVGGGKMKEFAYTSNATDAIDFVMDVNGKTGPNAETDEDEHYYDIRSFKIAAFSKMSVCPGEKVNGVCVVMLGSTTETVNCSNDKNEKYCQGLTSNFSYQAGARKLCAELGMRLPNSAEVKALINTNDKYKVTAHCQYNNHWFYTTSGGGCSDGYTYHDKHYGENLMMNTICIGD